MGLGRKSVALTLILSLLPRFPSLRNIRVCLTPGQRLAERGRATGRLHRHAASFLAAAPLRELADRPRHLQPAFDLLLCPALLWLVHPDGFRRRRAGLPLSSSMPQGHLHAAAAGRRRWRHPPGTAAIADRRWPPALASPAGPPEWLPSEWHTRKQTSLNVLSSLRATKLFGCAVTHRYD